jgi:hypothetical protein
MVIYPNPASDEVYVGVRKEYPIRAIDVYDLKGTLMSRHHGINHNFTHLPVRNLAPGQYILKVEFDEGIAARSLIVK